PAPLGGLGERPLVRILEDGEGVVRNGLGARQEQVAEDALLAGGESPHAYSTSRSSVRSAPRAILRKSHDDVRSTSMRYQACVGGWIWSPLAAPNARMYS